MLLLLAVVNGSSVVRIRLVTARLVTERQTSWCLVQHVVSRSRNAVHSGVFGMDRGT